MKEVFILAGMAKEIVALRSGLVDLLVYTKQPVKVIYTKARHREWFNQLSAQKIYNSFSFNQNQITEIINTDIEKNKLVEMILGGQN